MRGSSGNASALECEAIQVAARVLAAGGVVGILRRRRSCTLRGARAQWRLPISVVLLMVAVYAALYGLTAYLARAAS